MSEGRGILKLGKLLFPAVKLFLSSKLSGILDTPKCTERRPITANITCTIGTGKRKLKIAAALTHTSWHSN